MKTKELLDRLAAISAAITALYAEIGEELPDLRVVVDHTRDFSEVKKMPAKYLTFRALNRRNRRGRTAVTTTAML